MVCVPCVIVPILLLIWRFIVQPLVIKLWGIWRKEKGDDGVQQGGPPQLVKECKNGVCTLAWKASEKDTKVE